MQLTTAEGARLLVIVRQLARSKLCCKRHRVGLLVSSVDHATTSSFSISGLAIPMINHCKGAPRTNLPTQAVDQSLSLTAEALLSWRELFLATISGGWHMSGTAGGEYGGG